MSFLARLSLKNRSLIALATIAILLIGVFVIPTLKQELFPSLDFPAVSVVTLDAGASPTIVEHDVTNPLEQNIQGIAGIQQLTSYSNQGVSIIVVEFNFVGLSRHHFRQNAEFGLAAILKGLREHGGRNIRPIGVTFAHPRNSNLQEFERFFGCPVEYGAASDQWSFSNETLALPLIGDVATLLR